MAALKTFFDFLAEDSGELQWPNPVRFKRHAGKRGRQLPRDLSDATVEQLWQAITAPRDRAWFVLMWRGGLRVGEVVALQVEDLLSPAQGEQPARLRVCGKGRQERIILLSADAYAVLDAWLAERPADGEPHLFLNEHGRPLTANGIEWLLRGYGTAIGQHVTPHQLRHTYARQLTEAGMPLPSLSKLMGHAQITTTQIYTAGADPQLAQAYQTAVAHLAEPAREAPAAPVAGARPPAETPAPETPAARLERLGWPFARRHPASQPGLRAAASLHLGGPAPAPTGAECAQRAGASVGLVSGAAAADQPG